MATGHDGWNFRRYIVWCSGLSVGIIPVLLSWTEWKTEVYITVLENKGLVRKWRFEFHRRGGGCQDTQRPWMKGVTDCSLNNALAVYRTKRRTIFLFLSDEDREFRTQSLAP